uniref:Uncharacterized protein n=1 Tax=Caenorhabditis japonica TaxID=281687 RepID=A0A8R1E5Q4_CAEJA
MPRLARFWDSLENDNLFDIVAQPPQPTVTRFHQQWLNNLAHARDDEPQTILYAKPLLPTPEFIAHFPQYEEFYGGKKIPVGHRYCYVCSIRVGLPVVFKLATHTIFV